MQPNLIMTVGIQGSGKSTWAKKFIAENPDVIYLSTDQIWLTLGPMSDRSIAGKVYPILTRRAESALNDGCSVLLDATFVRKAWRKDYIKLGRRFGVKLIAHVFEADRAILLERINIRTSNGGLFVPVDVIDKYISMFEMPDKTEFDEIIKH